MNFCSRLNSVKCRLVIKYADVSLQVKSLIYDRGFMTPPLNALLLHVYLENGSKKTY